MKIPFSKILALVTCVVMAVCCCTTALGEDNQNGFTSAAESSVWEEKLKASDGVIRVEKIEIISSQRYTEKYLVTFEQPLDWKDPSKGTFPQRVEVDLREDAEYNILETNGYSLRPTIYLSYYDPTAEMPNLLKANFFNVEHRFFGESRPEDLSNDEVKYWEYDTPENAANDYHRIYTSLAPLFGERWIADGTSQGGEMTNTYGYFFPEDMMLYTARVAPCSEGPEDPRYYPFIYTEIGNTAFGEEKAKEYRDLILAFQVELMRNKETLLPDFEAAAMENGCAYREGATMERLYDLDVMVFAAGFWQYQQTPFEDLQAILDMPETTEEEKQAKMEAELKAMTTVQEPSGFSPSMETWPFFVDAATNYGEFHFDFSWLREALKTEGLEGSLSVAEGEEDGVLFDAVFTKEQRAAFTFDSSFREGMKASIRTTPARHLLIYGATDPWICMRIPDTDNPNVKIFIHPTKDHSASILSMPEEMREEVLAVLKEWIGYDAGI